MEKINNYTPGPWIIDKHSTIDKSFMVGPGIWVDYDDVDHKEQDANAQLIALAPTLYERYFKMLEALKGVLEMADSYYGSQQDSDDEDYLQALRTNLFNARQTIKDCNL